MEPSIRSGGRPQAGFLATSLCRLFLADVPGVGNKILFFGFR